MIKTYTAFAIAVLVFAIPHIADAHGTGITWNEEADGYYIDVDYSESTIEARTEGRFTFDIFADEERTESTQFTDLWVRIERSTSEEGEILFAGPISNAQFGGAGFSFSFPESGAYTLYVRYHDGEATLAETSFPIAVEPGRTGKGFDSQFGLGFAAGLIAAAVLFFFGRRFVGK